MAHTFAMVGELAGDTMKRSFAEIVSSNDGHPQLCWIAASLLPARRATKIVPLKALRTE